MSDTIRIRILPALTEIAAERWNALGQNVAAPKNQAGSASLAMVTESDSRSADARPEAGKAISNADESLTEQADSTSQLADSPSEEDTLNPFISHAFLNALEVSGSVGGRTGWTPLHLVAEDENGDILGALPVYAKSHSRGEYVFDHAFAEAYARAGGDYYPKLQISVPFTPATGRRLLVPRGPREQAIRAALINGLEGLRQRLDASSIHATFLTHRDRASFQDAGYLMRQDQQFHFENRGYASFEDFLGTLRSDKRKVLKRERRDALANGISVEWLTGRDITEAHWDAFFAFYIDTGSRKWGSPYLNRAFFSLIGETMAEQTLLMFARRDGRYVAGALNFIGANTLYGRHWGCNEHHPFLHFELCYYQAIDFALANGLARVEAGAQGEHKLARGYAPVRTTSVHRFSDPGFHAAVADYLKRELRAVDRAQNELEGLLPFRKSTT
jgi:uncharacterized protein